jgi:hypothetical protein
MAAAASGPRLEIVDDPFGFAAVGGDRVDVEMLMMTRRTRTAIATKHYSAVWKHLLDALL